MNKKNTIICALLFLSLFSWPAAATVAEIIPVGGVLTELDGTPLDGDYSVTFALYEDATTTGSLWQETAPAMPVTDGIFTWYMGADSLNPFDFFSLVSASELWLGLTVGTDSEMNRIQLGSVPFAVEAEYCRFLGTLEEQDVQPVLSGGNDCGGDMFLQGWDADAGVPICGEALGPDDGVALESWVGGQGYATETWVSSQGYLLGYTETDPVFAASAAAGVTNTGSGAVITVAERSNLVSAYGWGNHNIAGYMTSFTEVDPAVGSLTDGHVPTWDNAGGYLADSSLFVDGSGNVGIGTTSPAGMFVVNTKSNFGAGVVDQSQPTKGLYQPSDADNWQSFTAGITGRLTHVKVEFSRDASTSAYTLSIYEGSGTGGAVLATQVVTGGAQYVDITYAIGDTVLVEAGSMYTFRVVGDNIVSAGTGTTMSWADSNPYGAGSSDTSGDYYFSTTVASFLDDFVVAANGRVGIGTSSPAAALDVNGSIFQRGTSLHADYVFSDDYELESIEDHAEFMHANSHLSAIPKAFKDSKGLDVVEMGSHRRGIVEELEKAHLYIEQLNQENKELKSRLDALETLLK